jgi:hypothetical protein
VYEVVITWHVLLIIYADLTNKLASWIYMNMSKIFSNVSLFVMCASGILLYQCTASPDSSSSDNANYYNERQEIAFDLIALRNDIDRDIEKTGKTDATTKEEKSRQSRAVNTLLTKKSEVEEMLGTVNNATQDNWSKIRNEARVTVSDVKRVCQKLEKNEIARN